MPSNYPTPQQLQEEMALLQRMKNAGYAGIPMGGSMEPQMPSQAPLQSMGSQSVIPLKTVLRGFAQGGSVDGRSLEEPIAIDTQDQINTMMSNGGLADTARSSLASFAKGGDVDVNDFQPPLQAKQPSGMDVLKAEFAKRGLDFNKFVSSPPVMQQALESAKSMGINGDTMLAHINPREAELLKRHGGSGDVNPNTGLPMFEDGESDGNGEGNGNGNVGSNSDVSGRGQESGPGLGNNDSFGSNTGEQGPGLGLNDSFGANPNAQEQGPGLGLNDTFGGLSPQGPGLGLNDTFGAPTNEQGPGIGLNDTFGANPSVQGPGYGFNDTFGPASILGDVQFGLTNYDPVSGVPSVTGPTSTTTQSPSISNALSSVSPNATTAQIAAALAANAVQNAVQSPTSQPATAKSTVDVAETPEQVEALETAMMAPNQAPTTSAKASTTPTDIGTPATKSAQSTTVAEDISAAINNAITNALNNPMATAINTGLSLASPPLGLANMVSGLAGYGTIGSMVAGVNTNPSSNVAVAENETQAQALESQIGHLGNQPTSPSLASNETGGNDNASGETTSGAALAGVNSPSSASSVLASLANSTPVNNKALREYVGNKQNLLSYGYGPATNFYTYNSAKGGMVSPLKAMRKA